MGDDADRILDELDRAFVNDDGAQKGLPGLRRPSTPRPSGGGWPTRRRLDTHQRLEPPVGCYLGARVDRDDNVRRHVQAGQSYGSVLDFGRLTGRKHATFFTYRSYGEPLSGTHRVEVLVYDDQNRFVTKAATSVVR